MSIVLVIAITALITELIEFEEIAKTIVIPSLILLIIISGYSIFKTLRPRYSA
ncbi:MAG TPA: hypothetical protein VFG45_03375 [Candidatus Nitrosocosmicus sp.]|nr:hypothetical protein [Candidatus Nitrosocosmicus sp.]